MRKPTCDSRALRPLSALEFVLVLCLFAFTTTPVSAAGLDCAKAGDSVEKVICNEPALLALDQALAVAYAAATQSGNVPLNDLKADQIQWITERDEVALRWNFPDGSDSATFIKEIYLSRIDLLNSIVKPAKSGDATTAIRRAVQPWRSRAPSSFDADAPLQMLAKDKSIVLPARQHVEGLSKTTIGGTPSPELIATLRQQPFELNEDGHFNDVRLLTDAGFGGIWVVNGTADCEDAVLFKRDENGVAQRIPTPAVLDGNCWNESGYLVEIDGQVNAVRQRRTGVTQTDLEIQTWRSSQWSATEALRFRFAEKLGRVDVSCPQKPCADVQALADTLMPRFQHHPVRGSLDAPLTADENMEFERMQNYTGNALPAFMGTGDSDAPSFGDGVTTFPIRMNGRLLIAKIGHSHIGWRAYDDWILGLWAIRGDDLTPVGAARADVARSKFLFAISVTPAQ